jgi:hypothetical protein
MDPSHLRKDQRPDGLLERIVDILDEFPARFEDLRTRWVPIAALDDLFRISNLTLALRADAGAARAHLFAGDVKTLKSLAHLRELQLRSARGGDR